jgi:beta-glucosidase
MRNSVAALLVLLFFLFDVKAQNQPAYKNPKLSVEQRVEDLLQRMTLEEKVAQLQTTITLRDPKDIPGNGIGCLTEVFNGLTPGLAVEKYNALQKACMEKTRLGIPMLYHGEAVFGLMANGTTCFPQPLAQAATFNLDLHTQIAEAIAKEVKAWGHAQVLSPTINVAYDSRWGRTHETYGEDPYLVSMMGITYIKPMEAAGIITTPKHFAANIGHNGKFGGPISYSERFLREVEFPPFKAAVEAGCSSIMPAYNSIDGVPCSSNKWLLTDVLRNEWGFKGFIGSDYGAMDQIYSLHLVASTKTEAAILAMTAGMDVEMPEVSLYGEALMDAVNSGRLPMSYVDNAVRRVLYQKFRLGLFENPFADPAIAEKACNTEAHRALALETSRQSIVLLKNERVLPFKKSIKSIAVLGPLANEQLFGNYSSWGISKVSILEGIKRKVGKTVQVLTAKGVELTQLALPVISKENLYTEENGKEVNGLTAEYFNNTKLEGKPVATKVDETIDFDWGEGIPHPFINADNFSARWTGRLVARESGTFTIGITVDDGARLFIDDKLIIDEWRGGSARLSQAKYTFEKDRSYKIKLEYFEGTYNAVCKLGWNAQANSGIPQAVQLAQNADACVIVVGAMDGEGRDRADLDLTQGQEDLINAVAKTGKPFVVILSTGNVISSNDWADNTPAILESWYSGEEGGMAVADVLFGDYNPGGKLPITFPKVTGQVPCYYYSRASTSSSYLVTGNDPMFSFGHGLSYTTFEYSNLKLSSKRIKLGEKLVVTMDVKNSGKVKGDEVVQLYVKDNVGSVSPWPKRLRGFKRIALNPGEIRNIEFTIGEQDLNILNQQMKWVVEPGMFTIMIGSSSIDIRLQELFEVE